MATNSDLDRILRRLTRDLEAPMSLLAQGSSTPRLVGTRGFDRLVDAAHLLHARPDETRVSDWSDGPVRSFVRCSVAGDREGTIIVADRRRRWFDNDELRHLSLLGVQAGIVLAELEVIDIAETEPVRLIEPARPAMPARALV